MTEYNISDIIKEALRLAELRNRVVHPPPWTAVSSPCCPDRATIYDSNGQQVYETKQSTHAWDIADAELAAAAPDMAELLEKLVKLINLMRG